MKTTQKTELQIASVSSNTSTLEFLLTNKKKAHDSKIIQSNFTITAKEAAKQTGKRVQEIYAYLDAFKQKYETTYKPILVKGKDWDYIKGRIYLSEESFQILKEWIEKRKLTKAEA